MRIDLLRYSSGKESTLGLFYIDCKFQAFTLEDEYRTVKKYGETRIPEGEYKVSLRSEGGFHNRYKAKFPDIHNGMLCIYNSDDWKLINGDIQFQYILIHIGNSDDDTAGCVLVGDVAHQNITTDGFISKSVKAYKRIYKIISDALLKGEEVTIHIKDNI
jgi:hypothetical protein